MYLDTDDKMITLMKTLMMCRLQYKLVVAPGNSHGSTRNNETGNWEGLVGTRVIHDNNDNNDNNKVGEILNKRADFGIGAVKVQALIVNTLSASY